MSDKNWSFNHKNKTFQVSISLVDILRQRAQNQPEQKAYIFLQNGETEPGSLTYEELDRQARAIASHLQSWQRERALLLYPSEETLLAASEYWEIPRK